MAVQFVFVEVQSDAHLPVQTQVHHRKLYLERVGRSEKKAHRRVAAQIAWRILFVETSGKDKSVFENAVVLTEGDGCQIEGTEGRCFTHVYLFLRE